MPTQKYLIRGIASLIYLIKRRELRSPHLKFLVFTGTSGKTTLRDAVTFGLQAIGQRVESNHVGYSNELGIVLTAFGIPDASLKKPSTWRKIFQAHFTQDTYVCIESGADFTDDLLWFLRRFVPHAVFIGGITHEAWAGDLKRTAKQRQRLIHAVPKDGMIVYNADDVSVAADILAAQPTAQTRSVSLQPHREADVALQEWTRAIYTQPVELLINAEETLTIHETRRDTNLRLKRPVFEPQALALLTAWAFLNTRFPEAYERLINSFESYPFSHNRLQLSLSSNGTLIIEDSYKATPYCTNWFLEMAQRVRAKKKILVLSELRPLENNVRETYERIEKTIGSFDQIYFVGPRPFYEILRTKNPALQYLEDATAPQFVAELIQSTKQGDCIFLKGSFRYHLDQLRASLTA